MMTSTPATSTRKKSMNGKDILEMGLSFILLMLATVLLCG